MKVLSLSPQALSSCDTEALKNILTAAVNSNCRIILPADYSEQIDDTIFGADRNFWRAEDQAKIVQQQKALAQASIQDDWNKIYAALGAVVEGAQQAKQAIADDHTVVSTFTNSLLETILSARINAVVEYIAERLQSGEAIKTLIHNLFHANQIDKLSNKFQSYLKFSESTWTQIVNILSPLKPQEHSETTSTSSMEKEPEPIASMSAEQVSELKQKAVQQLQEKQKSDETYKAFYQKNTKHTQSVMQELFRNAVRDKWKNALSAFAGKDIAKTLQLDSSHWEWLRQTWKEQLSARVAGTLLEAKNQLPGALGIALDEMIEWTCDTTESARNEFEALKLAFEGSQAFQHYAVTFWQSAVAASFKVAESEVVALRPSENSIQSGIAALLQNAEFTSLEFAYRLSEQTKNLPTFLEYPELKNPLEEYFREHPTDLFAMTNAARYAGKLEWLVDIGLVGYGDPVVLLVQLEQYRREQSSSSVVVGWSELIWKNEKYQNALVNVRSRTYLFTDDQARKNILTHALGYVDDQYRLHLLQSLLLDPIPAVIPRDATSVRMGEVNSHKISVAFDPFANKPFFITGGEQNQVLVGGVTTGTPLLTLAINYDEKTIRMEVRRGSGLLLLPPALVQQRIAGQLRFTAAPTTLASSTSPVSVADEGNSGLTAVATEQQKENRLAKAYQQAIKQLDGLKMYNLDQPDIAKQYAHLGLLATLLGGVVALLEVLQRSAAENAQVAAYLESLHKVFDALPSPPSAGALASARYFSLIWSAGLTGAVIGVTEWVSINQGFLPLVFPIQAEGGRAALKALIAGAGFFLNHLVNGIVDWSVGNRSALQDIFKGLQKVVIQVFVTKQDDFQYRLSQLEHEVKSNEISVLYALQMMTALLQQYLRESRAETQPSQLKTELQELLMKFETLKVAGDELLRKISFTTLANPHERNDPQAMKNLAAERRAKFWGAATTFGGFPAAAAAVGALLIKPEVSKVITDFRQPDVDPQTKGLSILGTILYGLFVLALALSTLSRLSAVVESVVQKRGQPTTPSTPFARTAIAAAQEIVDESTPLLHLN